MTTNKTIPVSSPYIFLPLIEVAGTTSVVDTGIGATWTASGVSTFGSTAGFNGSNANNNHFYCDDAAVIDLFNVFNGAVDGVGGKVLFLSMTLTGWTSGISTELLQFGSRNSASGGWELTSSSGNDLTLLTNPDGAGIWSGAWKIGPSLPTSGEYHLAMMLDFKGGFFRTWIDADTKLPASVDRYRAMVAGNPGGPGDGTMGVTVFARDSVNTTAGARSPSAATDGAIKNLLAMDLTSVDNPWRYAARNVKHLVNSRFPASLGDW